jgi:hypothetical protein
VGHGQVDGFVVEMVHAIGRIAISAAFQVPEGRSWRFGALVFLCLVSISMRRFHFCSILISAKIRAARQGVVLRSNLGLPALAGLPFLTGRAKGKGRLRRS